MNSYDFYSDKIISNFDKNAREDLRCKIEVLRLLRSSLKKINSISVSINLSRSEKEKEIKAILLFDDVNSFLKEKSIKINDFSSRPIPNHFLSLLTKRIWTFNKRLEVMQANQPKIEIENFFENNFFNIKINNRRNIILIASKDIKPLSFKNLLRNYGFKWSTYYKAWTITVNSASNKLLKQQLFIEALNNCFKS